ncbi:interleukin-2 receptor subunit alpha [Nannospalax galili]|uniref:interleukin-2 receptor subunit alpha n=1 Tax=Nannospalax galili TaxID=1026970 RepID=UPI0004ED6842|nr:interleukin-2 receptor subunit alpha [Nannospalax galili]
MWLTDSSEESAICYLTGNSTKMCLYNPPEVPYATFKALAYKNGTMLNCDCKKGFRRVNGLLYVLCSGNSSWSNTCQCASNSNRNTRKRVTPQPEEHKERQTTETQSSAWSVDQGNIPGHCREPPPWDHESTKRIYHLKVGQTVYYQCIQGYKALQKHPATSVCKTICGKTGWTQPRLTCVDEREHHQFQDKEEYLESTDTLPESETSCPITITDTQQPPEATTTMETFFLTMEHQITVAGCVFLLISILLLSGLTWRWRWKKSRRTI